MNDVSSQAVFSLAFLCLGRLVHIIRIDCTPTRKVGKLAMNSAYLVQWLGLVRDFIGEEANAYASDHRFIYTIFNHEGKLNLFTRLHENA